ncbi:hypothetical protein UFOVP523_32 [uncultured Caudovirales phage]|uniref:Uncharacterized protein n=1 Tax=uncultured Caudovirales phage TaxID=2100421 RepID=A0A6J5MQF0_9CAUD|nr:hypothetical protein UFOVP523_32 [uncultured Caudovirales phage]
MKKEIKQKVRSILELVPSTRNNDNELIATYWENELGHELINMSAGEFLYIYSTSNVLTNAESIRRNRQKIQEQNEHLRGLKYRVRQILGEEVRQTIKDL